MAIGYRLSGALHLECVFHVWPIGEAAAAAVFAAAAAVCLLCLSVCCCSLGLRCDDSMAGGYAANKNDCAPTGCAPARKARSSKPASPTESCSCVSLYVVQVRCRSGWGHTLNAAGGTPDSAPDGNTDGPGDGCSLGIIEGLRGESAEALEGVSVGKLDGAGAAFCASPPCAAFFSTAFIFLSNVLSNLLVGVFVYFDRIKKRKPEVGTS